jgi:outer membrane receptor protein involved in Fe transport
MAYVRVASGYQPGGPNLAIPGIPSTFASDSLTNYEVGVKSEFFDKRVLFDVDGFYIDWNDIQLLSNGAGFSYGINGGTAKSQGIEANATVRPIQGLVLDGTFTYLDAVLTQNAPAIGGLSGDRLPNIPSLSGSLRVSYSEDLTDGWTGTIGGGLRAEDRRYSDVNHAFDSRPIPGFASLDLNADVSNDTWTVQRLPDLYAAIQPGDRQHHPDRGHAAAATDDRPVPRCKILIARAGFPGKKA